MSDNPTMESFAEPLTPEQITLKAAMAEIKDEVGKFKNSTQTKIKSLKKARRDENIPSKQAPLDQQIAEKQQELKEVKCVFDSGGSALQNHYRKIVKWDEIMRKHGVRGY